MISTGVGGFENKRTSGDHPNYSIVEIGHGFVRIVAVTWTPVENHHLSLVRRTLKWVKKKKKKKLLYNNESCGNNSDYCVHDDHDDERKWNNNTNTTINNNNNNDNDDVRCRIICKFSDFDFDNAFRIRSKAHLLLSDMTIFGVGDFGGQSKKQHNLSQPRSAQIKPAPAVWPSSMLDSARISMNGFNETVGLRPHQLPLKCLVFTIRWSSSTNVTGRSLSPGYPLLTDHWPVQFEWPVRQMMLSAGNARNRISISAPRNVKMEIAETLCNMDISSFLKVS